MRWVPAFDRSDTTPMTIACLDIAVLGSRGGRSPFRASVSEKAKNRKSPIVMLKANAWRKRTSNLTSRTEGR